jgi:fibronectin type 3 domain-containing protein
MSALQQYEASWSIRQLAVRTYRGSKLTTTRMDDVRALTTLRMTHTRMLMSARALIAAETRQAAVISEVTAQIRSTHYVRAPRISLPGRPGTVTAVAGDGEVTLSWTAVANATSYEVRRDGVSIGNAATTSFIDQTAANGHTYSYDVVAHNTAGSSPVSTSVSASPTATAPAAPQGLFAPAGDNSVDLAWLPSDRATGYNIYRDGNLIGTTSATTYSDTSARNGTAYSYTVTALRDTAESTPSGAVSVTPIGATPSAPVGISTVVGDGEIALSWSAPAGANHYEIFRDGASIGTSTTASYTATGLTNGTSYSFTVVAYRDNSLGSAPSDAVNVTAVAVAPDQPTGLTAAAGDARIALTWSAPAGATSYRIFRDGVSIATTTTPAYTDTTAANAVSYAYYVVAYKENSPASAASSIVTSTPIASAPNRPTFLRATAGDGQVALTWTAPANATSYGIYRGGTLIGTSTTASYTDTNAANGTSYNYYVVAYNLNSAPSTQSYTVTATPTAVAPAAPAAVVASPGDSQVILSWAAPSGADAYKVYRNGTLVTSTAITATTFTDSGLTNGTTYSYYVVAFKQNSAPSAASGTVTATPQAASVGTPTGLAATAGDAQISLTWNASAGATSYQILRNGTQVGTSASASYTDTALTNGTAYTYTVKAVIGGVTSSASTSVSATPIAAAPTAPTGVTATVGSAQIGLTWTAPAGADKYSVYRNGTLVASVTSPSYTDTGLTNGTTYSYYIVAFKQNSAASAASAPITATPVAAKPATPTGVTATAGNAQVVVSWTAVSGATGYSVYRDGTLVGSPTATTYTDTGLTNGTAYTYTVTANNTGGSSTASAGVTATPQVPAPGIPTGVTATAGVNQVTITWTAVSGATSYQLYRGATLVASPTTTSYVDTSLTAGTAVSYTVKAVNAGGTSAASAAASATPTLAAPTGLTATAGNAQVALTWTAVANATSYNVYSGATLLGNVTTTSYTHTGLTNGTVYTYTVTAVVNAVASPASLSVTATPTAPVKPLVTGTFAGPLTSFVVTGQGVTNTVTVTVTLTNSVITNATATYTVPSGDSTSTRIIKGAIPTLNSEAIAANSATIANVSGATYISKAYMQSLTGALTTSGR